MTVATLLFTCLIFLLVGWTSGPYYVTALSVGAIVTDGVLQCLGHNFSFDLRDGPLFTQLDEEERKFVRDLSENLKSESEKRP